MGRRKTTEEFIIDAYCKHNDGYNYKLVEYKNSKTKVKIICPVHGVFEQTPDNHLSGNGNGCPKCKSVNHSKRISYNTNDFIIRSNNIHNHKYIYDKVVYKGCRTKVKIICPDHGVFEQIPYYHISGNGCPKCAGQYGKYPYCSFDAWYDKISKYIECLNDDGFVSTKCTYCGKYYRPLSTDINSKYRSIMGKLNGENNLYCSDNCKKSCPTYNQKKYPKDHDRQSSSREAQPALRKMVLERDNYQCIRCGKTNKEAQLHCHHLTGVELNPIESADIDNCVTLCKECHKQSHKEKGCGYQDLRKKECKKECKDENR